jgi:hypothetical protein
MVMCSIAIASYGPNVTAVWRGRNFRYEIAAVPSLRRQACLRRRQRVRASFAVGAAPDTQVALVLVDAIRNGSGSEGSGTVTLDAVEPRVSGSVELTFLFEPRTASR